MFSRFFYYCFVVVAALSSADAHLEEPTFFCQVVCWDTLYSLILP